LTKRGISIIPEDHLGDMTTRALSTDTLTTAGGYKSTAIDTFDEVRSSFPFLEARNAKLKNVGSGTLQTDENQMWIVTKAPAKDPAQFLAMALSTS